MPFAANRDLPDRITKLPERLQTVFRKAFNAAWDATCKDGGKQGDREACAFAVANAAVNRAKGQKSEHFDLDGFLEDYDEDQLELVFEKQGSEGATGMVAKLLRALADFIKGQGPPGIGETPFRAVEVSGGTVDDHARIRVERSVAIIKMDPEQRLVIGVVYEPEVADAHKDAMAPPEIQKSAHSFMIRYATLSGETGVEHKAKAARAQLPIVESFIAPVDYELNEQTITKGSWVMAVKVLDDGLWKAVKDRKYTGFSFEGFGRRIAA
jgi:cation transport regulator ChaB